MNPSTATPDHSWIQGLAHFLNQETGVEAILVDIDNKKISVATLGPVNQAALTKRLQETLRQIEQTLHAGKKSPFKADVRRVTVRPIPGKTLLEKPSCLTAPRLWVWRDVEWHQPHFHEHHEDWRHLAVFTAVCGISGIAGYLSSLWAGAPTWLEGLLFGISMLAGGWDAAKEALEELPKGRLDIHFLMLAVALGATLIGAWKEGALLFFLFSLSGTLEHFALYRTRKAINALFKIAPPQALILQADGTEQTLSVDAVTPGNILIVKPGDLFPVDAEVIKGETAADESNLTGEAVPIPKSIGDTVYSGTLNIWGSVQAKVIRPAADSALQKIIRLIEEAQHLKAQSQRFTDKFGTPYTYAILAMTTVMFLIWWLGFGLTPFKTTPEAPSAFYRAMTLLVVASPCALVLSIPSAILAAIAWGASHGILFRGGAAIEKLAEVNVVAFDKTGTLTTGELEVIRIESFPEGEESTILQTAFSLEQHASHPIARAIVRYGKSQGLTALDVEQFTSLSGHGIRGTVQNAECVLGRRELLRLGPLAEWIHKVPLPSEDFSEVWVVHHNHLGRILLKDTLREASQSLLETLHTKHIHTVMLTGDHRVSAESVGRRIQIQEIRSGLTPEQKVAAIQELGQSGRKVAMIGDGVNDAPSLAAAYVSVAMGARGSDAALEQSEVVLMNDKIENFLAAYNLSIKARRIIYQNLFISLGTLLVMTITSSFSYLPLTLGVIAHEGSTVLVCLNSLRLLWHKGPKVPAPKHT